MQPHWPWQPQKLHWPQGITEPFFPHKNPDLDDFITRSTKLTNTGPFLWIGSIKIPNFTVFGNFSVIGF